jgi:hypothetical protein
VRTTPGQWQWFAAGAVAFPLVVLLHELGHYVAAVAVGFRDVRLHFMSVSSPELELLWSRFAADRAAGGTESISWKAVLPIAAGVGSTYLTILGSCVVVACRRADPLIVWLGLAAPMRFHFSAGAALAWITGQASVLTAEDESRLGAVLGLHPGALVSIGMVVSLVASVWLLGRVRYHPITALLFGSFGVVFGMILYGGVIGPLLLP